MERFASFLDTLSDNLIFADASDNLSNASNCLGEIGIVFNMPSSVEPEDLILT